MFHIHLCKIFQNVNQSSTRSHFHFLFRHFLGAIRFFLFCTIIGFFAHLYSVFQYPASLHVSGKHQKVSDGRRNVDANEYDVRR